MSGCTWGWACACHTLGVEPFSPSSMWDLVSNSRYQASTGRAFNTLSHLSDLIFNFWSSCLSLPSAGKTGKHKEQISSLGPYLILVYVPHSSFNTALGTWQPLTLPALGYTASDYVYTPLWTTIQASLPRRITKYREFLLRDIPGLGPIYSELLGNCLLTILYPLW